MPTTLVKWLYANSNPVMYTDPTGLSPQVECSNIAFSDLRAFCVVANGDDSDPNTINARWNFFHRLSFYSSGYSLLGGSSYSYAGFMLDHFLTSNDYVTLNLSPYENFGEDQGIIRETKIKMPRKTGNDESQDIRPLLHFFILDYIKPLTQENNCNEFFKASSYTAFGKDTYQTGKGVRPYDKGWWGAFGHVDIDATYTNTTVKNQNDGYVVSTLVNYHIDDSYSWFYGTSTPFGPPVASPEILIPHEWELSLVNAGKAYMFNFEVNWSEKLDIYVPNDFSYYTINHDKTHLFFQ